MQICTSNCLFKNYGRRIKDKQSNNSYHHWYMFASVKYHGPLASFKIITCHNTIKLCIVNELINYNLSDCLWL